MLAGRAVRALGTDVYAPLYLEPITNRDLPYSTGTLLRSVCVCVFIYGFPSSSAVKNPSAVLETQETWVQSLG